MARALYHWGRKQHRPLNWVSAGSGTLSAEGKGPEQLGGGAGGGGGEFGLVDDFEPHHGAGACGLAIVDDRLAVDGEFHRGKPDHWLALRREGSAQGQAQDGAAPKISFAVHHPGAVGRIRGLG